jgi:hypothetical protein
MPKGGPTSTALSDVADAECGRVATERLSNELVDRRPVEQIAVCVAKHRMLDDVVGVEPRGQRLYDTMHDGEIEVVQRQRLVDPGQRRAGGPVDTLGGNMLGGRLLSARVSWDEARKCTVDQRPGPLEIAPDSLEFDLLDRLVTHGNIVTPLASTYNPLSLGRPVASRDEAVGQGALATLESATRPGSQSLRRRAALPVAAAPARPFP